LRAFVQKHESERGECDLHVLIEEALALALVGASRQGASVQLMLMPGVLEINVDRVQILQVLVNLVRNGIDAMDALQQREITIATAIHNPNFVRVSISDMGCGIAPEIDKELFDSFVTTKTHGLGIGLSISKKIIEAHEGEIWCAPNESVGTTFHFTVPLARAARTDRD
jgi:two-component system sensor kinase FixL